MPTPGFDDFDLPRKIRAALVLEDIDVPTPVQAAVIPDAMAGHDVLGRARTGSGKTLAFGIPVVARLRDAASRPHHPRALVIVPTRELAGQVQRSMELVARAGRLRVACIYGGTRYDKQIEQLRGGADIVVATPGRLRDLIDKGILHTDDVEVTVLDEADHLCDLGFFPEVDALLSMTPPQAQRMLLSATLDGDVDLLVRRHLRDPRRHEVDPSAGAVTTMDHHVLVVGGFRDKTAAAARLVRANPRAIVFTRTRDAATQLREALVEQGVSAVDLHGNLNQKVRERNLARFSEGRAHAVVATDVAARGIHVDNVAMVVHFDPPSGAKDYLHRSGRTARAGESGAVVSLVTPRQVELVSRLHRDVGVQARHHDLRTTTELSAVALAGSGTAAPQRSRSKQGPRQRSEQGAREGSQQGTRRGAQQRPQGRPRTGGAPHRNGAPARRAGGHSAGKQRWSKQDRAGRSGS